MASRFDSASEEEIISINEETVPKNIKMATKVGLTVFNGKLFNLSNPIFLGEKTKYNALFTKTIDQYNYKIRERSNTKTIDELVRLKRWKWLGHVLRMSPNMKSKIALTFAPDGQRSRGDQERLGEGLL